MVLLQIEIAKMLVEKAKIEQQSIVILSPYNAQVSEIRDELKKKKMDQITITTITKSQGDSVPLNNKSFTESKVATLQWKSIQSKTIHCEELFLSND